jgi:hypothetical protein
MRVVIDNFSWRYGWQYGIQGIIPAAATVAFVLVISADHPIWHDNKMLAIALFLIVFIFGGARANVRMAERETT